MMCCHRLLEAKVYFYCVMFYLFMQSTSAQNFLSCPRFTEGREDSIKLTVTKSAFSSPTPCFQPPTSVVFYFQPKNEGRAIWCTTSYKECPNTGQPLPACRNCACGCENDDVNTTVLSMHFTPSAAHLGGTFSSEVNCIHTVNTPLQTNENCAPISLELSSPPTTGAPRTTARTSTTVTDANNESDSHRSSVIWMVVGVAMALWKWLLPCVLH